MIHTQNLQPGQIHTFSSGPFVGDVAHTSQVTTSHFQGQPTVVETRRGSATQVEQGVATTKTTTTTTGTHEFVGANSYAHEAGQMISMGLQGSSLQPGMAMNADTEYQMSGLTYGGYQGGHYVKQVMPNAGISNEATTMDETSKISGQIFRQGVQPSVHIGGQFTSQGNTTGTVVGATTNTGMQGHTTTSYVTGENTTASYVSGSRIVTGEERVIGVNTIQQEERVISERIVEHEVKVPKRIVREEVIEKTIVVPETIFREEVVEERHLITEKIIEVARPIVHEKIVEVPEIEYRDKIVEKVEKIQQEKIVEVPRIQYEERIVEVPRTVYQDKIVEVPEIEYREVIVEKVIEVPEVREHVVVKEVPVPQYIEKPVQEIRDVPQPVNIERNIPVPVEAITTFEYQLAQFRPRVNKVQYPLYVPHFVEVPVSAELFDEQTVAALEAQGMKLQILKSAHALGLCEVENLATEVRKVDPTTNQSSSVDLQSALASAWKSGRIGLKARATASRLETVSMTVGSSVVPGDNQAAVANAPSASFAPFRAEAPAIRVHHA